MYIFTTQRYALARSLLWSGVCPSICPTVTLADYIPTAEDIVKHLVWPGTSITRVF